LQEVSFGDRTQLYFSDNIGGTSPGTYYYITKISEKTCKISTTLANARAGTYISYVSSASNVTANPISFRQIIEVKNKNFIFGYGPGIYDAVSASNGIDNRYNTPPFVDYTEDEPWNTGDRVNLNVTGFASGSATEYRLYGERDLLDLIAPAPSAGGSTLKFTDNSQVLVGNEIGVKMDNGQIHWSTVATIIDTEQLTISDPIPPSRSVAIGAQVYAWRWNKAGYGNLITDVVTYNTSPSFPNGITLNDTDLTATFNNGLNLDVTKPAIKIKNGKILAFPSSTDTASGWIYNTSTNQMRFA
jgi:hypothetical protein